jgi:hypothetical protein
MKRSSIRTQVIARIQWFRLLATAVMLCLGVGAAALVARAGADSSSGPAVELHLDTIEGNGVSPDGTTPMGPTPDSSGNGLTATASGTIMPGGRFGNALYMGYQGYDDNSVTVADNPLLRPTQITVMAWINRLDSPGADRLIVGKPFPPPTARPRSLRACFSIPSRRASRSTRVRSAARWR